MNVRLAVHRVVAIALCGGILSFDLPPLAVASQPPSDAAKVCRWRVTNQLPPIVESYPDSRIGMSLALQLMRLLKMQPSGEARAISAALWGSIYRHLLSSLDEVQQRGTGSTEFAKEFFDSIENSSADDQTASEDVRQAYRESVSEHLLKLGRRQPLARPLLELVRRHHLPLITDPRFHRAMIAWTRSQRLSFEQITAFYRVIHDSFLTEYPEENLQGALNALAAVLRVLVVTRVEDKNHEFLVSSPEYARSYELDLLRDAGYGIEVEAYLSWLESNKAVPDTQQKPLTSEQRAESDRRERDSERSKSLLNAREFKQGAATSLAIALQFERSFVRDNRLAEVVPYLLDEGLLNLAGTAISAIAESLRRAELRRPLADKYFADHQPEMALATLDLMRGEILSVKDEPQRGRVVQAWASYFLSLSRLDRGRAWGELPIGVGHVGQIFSESLPEDGKAVDRELLRKSLEAILGLQEATQPPLAELFNAFKSAVPFDGDAALFAASSFSDSALQTGALIFACSIILEREPKVWVDPVAN